MQLSFSLELNGKKTFFVEKILSGLHGIPEFKGFNLSNKYSHDLDYLETCISKIHTIRADYSHKWKKGMKIHFVINARTKNRFQFADIQTVKDIQEVWISPSNKQFMVWSKDFPNAGDTCITGYWKKLTEEQIEVLSKNDGFDSIEDFWNYFNEEFFGKIIHWTNLIY